MRRMMALLAGALLMAACSSIDCPLENTVSVVCGFYKADGRPDTLLVDTLTVTTARRDGNDTVLINRDVKAKGMTLPISSGVAADTFNVCLTDTLRRKSVSRIIISKTDVPHFESVDCKMSYFHTINSVTWSGDCIDSVTIHKSNVDYDASQKHLYIYFKARP